MESLTKENATILLNTNSIGGKIIRKNYKNRSMVKIYSKRGELLTKYRFNNISLEYETKYMNWQNVECCGGWDYSDLDLLNQVKSDKKLFTQLLYTEDMYDKNEVDKLLMECSKIDSIIIKEVHRYDTEYPVDIMLFKEGSVSDYIDVDKVLNEYKRFGIGLYDEEIELIKEMAAIPMIEYITPDNVFGYSYLRPYDNAELIFTGMLLGYPLESTVDRISYE